MNRFFDHHVFRNFQEKTVLAECFIQIGESQILRCNGVEIIIENLFMFCIVQRKIKGKEFHIFNGDF